MEFTIYDVQVANGMTYRILARSVQAAGAVVTRNSECKPDDILKVTVVDTMDVRFNK